MNNATGYASSNSSNLVSAPVVIVFRGDNSSGLRGFQPQMPVFGQLQDAIDWVAGNNKPACYQYGGAASGDIAAQQASADGRVSVRWRTTQKTFVVYHNGKRVNEVTIEGLNKAIASATSGPSLDVSAIRSLLETIDSCVEQINDLLDGNN